MASQTLNHRGLVGDDVSTRSHHNTPDRHKKWTHKFMCLTNCERKTRPSTSAQEKLRELGLGFRKIQLSSAASSTDIQAKLQDVYPKLKHSGGFDLLIQDKSQPTELKLIKPATAGYNAQFLHGKLGSAICYIRPRQNMDKSHLEANADSCKEQCNNLDPPQSFTTNLSVRLSPAGPANFLETGSSVRDAGHSNLAEEFSRLLDDCGLSSTDSVREQTPSGDDIQQTCDNVTKRHSANNTHFQARGSSASHTDHSLGMIESNHPVDEYVSSPRKLSTPEWPYGQDENSGTAHPYDSSYETSWTFRENHDVIQSETSSDAQAVFSSDDDVNKTHTHGGSGNETTPESGIGDIQADQLLPNETSETFLESQDVLQSKTSSHSKELNSPEVMRISPDFCSIQGGCSFIIVGNQILSPGKYHIVFEHYGICEASGKGTQYLEGKEAIPAAKRRGTHSIQVDVFTASGEQIGVFRFMYVDTAGKICVQRVIDSSSTDTLDPPNRPTKRLSNECEENPSQNKRMKSYPIDMSMLMYLCDEMAKRGDEDFFRALIKLGILGDVLTNRSKYFNSFALTAKEHGYSELAELIAMYSRNTSRDCLMENLTLEKLVDAVQRERSLVNSIDSSDDDSDSCLSGYNGDYDSEDEKLSSNADSDDDSRSGNILLELNEEKESANCVITEQGEKVQEEERKLQLELEAKAQEKDVTKRVSSEKNTPMICAQVESSGVETSRSITAKNGFNNMDDDESRSGTIAITAPDLSCSLVGISRIAPVLYCSHDGISRIGRFYIRSTPVLYCSHDGISLIEKERKRQLQLGRFKSRGGGWKVILKSPRSGCGKSVVDLTRKRKMTFSNSSLSDLNFKDPTIMKQSLAFLRNILVFIDKLHMQEKRHGLHNLTNPLTVSMENRFHELAVIGGMDERTEGPGDEVQSTCAKDVTWIALDLAGIGDEVVATKVEILSEAISENDSEN